MTNRRLRVDFHTHSRFAMSTSPSLDIATLSATARRKGLDVLTTGDFTHPAWCDELKRDLSDVGDGVYASDSGTRFILGTEISCVWKQDGRGRRVHLLVLVPDFSAADELSNRLGKLARLESDGRPIIKISALDLSLMAWEVDDRSVIIPAHVWTPWYGLLGSKSGFDSIGEAFGEHAHRIRAIESGLSSDPAMNWRIGELDSRAIVSFSDAHSPGTMGREFTVVESDMSFDGLTSAVQGDGIVETVEFFPENGKYHLNGHRKCGVRLEPSETPADGRCPECNRPLTLGVVQRIDDLATRPTQVSMTKGGLIRHSAIHETRPPFRRMVRLNDVLSEAFGVGPNTKTVGRTADALIAELGSEFDVLLSASVSDITAASSERVAAAISAVRRGDVDISPGFDGEYGAVKISF
ncbi:MAG: DNA helicase UvrD [Chloroflexi bacterium]|nr:DNA helicase UvrD [Chloroflexota bacterium]